MIVMECTCCARLSAETSHGEGMYFLKGLVVIRGGFDILSGKAEELEAVDYISLSGHVFNLCQSFICLQIEFLH